MKKTIVVSILLVLVSATWAVSQTSQLIYGCVNVRTGALRIVSSPGLCKTKGVQAENAITLSSGDGSKGNPGPEGPQGPKGEKAESLYIHDAADNPIGIVIDFERGFIFDPKSGYAFFLDKRVDLLFLDVACKGRAYTTITEIPGANEGFLNLDPADIAFNTQPYADLLPGYPAAFYVADMNSKPILVDPSTTDLYRLYGGLCRKITGLPGELLNANPAKMGFLLQPFMPMHLEFHN